MLCTPFLCFPFESNIIIPLGECADPASPSSQCVGQDGAKRTCPAALGRRKLGSMWVSEFPFTPVLFPLVLGLCCPCHDAGLLERRWPPVLPVANLVSCPQYRCKPWGCLCHMGPVMSENMQELWVYSTVTRSKWKWEVASIFKCTNMMYMILSDPGCFTLL